MEEKKKYTPKEESPDYGLTGDDCRPFSEDAGIRRLQNAFGEALGDLPLPEETREAWTAFLQRQEQKKRQAYRRIWLSGGMAAAIALLLILWSPWNKSDSTASDIKIFAALNVPEQVTTQEKNGRIIVFTPPTTIINLTLEDGTHVLLSANSRLEYPKEFTPQNKRIVTLTGEARFEVAKDSLRPFIVSTGDIQTQVLGTVFDVNAYPCNTPTVTLYRGRVQVAKTASSHRKEISPGQSATLETNGDIVVSKATQTEKEGWTDNEFYFDNTKMMQVLQSLGTWYNISVICHSPNLLQKRIHFRFSRNVSVESLLDALNDLGIAHFQYKNGQIMVY